MIFLSKNIKRSITQNLVIIMSSLLIVAFLNNAFFVDLMNVYPLSENLKYIASIVTGLILLNIIIIRIFCMLVGLKIGVGIILLMSTTSAYFMDSYNIIVDQVMLTNIAMTDLGEIYDLLSWRLLIYILIFTVIPCIFVFKIKIKKQHTLARLKKDVLFILACTSGIFLLVFMSSKFYASFFREHKEIRYKVNPVHGIYSAAKIITSKLKSQNHHFEQIGLDAKIPDSDKARDLVILVLGETARSDRFSLNGYDKKTNPLLEQENIVSFTNMFSCGTSTAYSVPCMFGLGGSDKFEHERVKSMDNVLDVLSHTSDVNILWRDNNSDSKGVALRVKYEDYKSSRTNTICDEECRDEGMLVGLQAHINSVKEKDILIVLHQMGSHGPSYYRRYPKQFEKYVPTCNTNELEQCSFEEINNTYDNTILYTDYFLHKVIQLLKINSDKFETAMFYISDHGESLGENGIYLHSLPNLIAPQEQKHIPAIMWFGGVMKDEINIKSLRKSKDKIYTHDYFFNTLLGLFEVETKVYRKEIDILSPYYLRNHEKHNK